jgi:hypothetical protein
LILDPPRSSSSSLSLSLPLRSFDTRSVPLEDEARSVLVLLDDRGLAAELASPPSKDESHPLRKAETEDEEGPLEDRWLEGREDIDSRKLAERCEMGKDRTEERKEGRRVKVKRHRSVRLFSFSLSTARVEEPNP